MNWNIEFEETIQLIAHAFGECIQELKSKLTSLQLYTKISMALVLLLLRVYWHTSRTTLDLYLWCRRELCIMKVL